jgi:hypothetical protein
MPARGRRGYRGRVETAQRRQRILDSFLREGRLTTIPARAAKRQVVLEHIVAVFEPGVKFAEKEVDAALRAFYERDWVSLRRYLIDTGLMAREGGLYWRTGGYVEV